MFKRSNNEDDQKDTQGVVNVATSEMKEVKYDPSKHVVSDNSFKMKTVLDSLMGKMKSEAQALLDSLVSDKKISEYRIAPIGVVVTQDYKPSRVSIMLDADGKVIDAQQG